MYQRIGSEWYYSSRRTSMTLLTIRDINTQLHTLCSRTKPSSVSCPCSCTRSGGDTSSFSFTQHGISHNNPVLSAPNTHIYPQRTQLSQKHSASAPQLAPTQQYVTVLPPQPTGHCFSKLGFWVPRIEFTVKYRIFSVYTCLVVRCFSGVRGPSSRAE